MKQPRPLARGILIPIGEPELAVQVLLHAIGENIERDGLIDTPARVVKALREMTDGYRMDPQKILSKRFDVVSTEPVWLRRIDFTSLCEHHLLPFVGTAVVGYLPGDSVIGLSKLARLVECFARRLQVQERMTEQIATALMEHGGARGSAVMIRAHHSCMGCRGVRQQSAEMVTTCSLGEMQNDPMSHAQLFAT